MAIKPILFNTISIHAPTRGATITGAVLCLLNRYFNPRSYKRSDYMVRLEWTDKGNISIHAPTRGATMLRLVDAIEIVFQSTLLQEERLSLRTGINL